MSDHLLKELAQRGLTRRDFVRLSLLCGAGLATSNLLFGCGPRESEPGAPADKPATDKPRGTLTIAQGADLTSTDPQQTQGSAPRAIVAGMFDQFVMLDHEYKVVPWIAKSWTNPDDLTWEFELRDDIYFHNGQQLTAKDVEWSIERFVDPATKNIYAGTLEPVADIQIIDDFHMKILTEKPYPFLLSNMALYFFVSSKDAMQEMGDSYFENPIGSGPYAFEEWIPGDRVTQVAGEPHFSGLPLVEKVVWRTITESATKLTALKTGEVDLIDGVPAERIDELENTPGIHVVQEMRHSSMLFVLNCQMPPFDDVRVRQALNYAVNMEEIIDHVLFGAGRPSNGPLSDKHEGYNDKLEPYPYDPQKAKELLAAAGYEAGFSAVLSTPSGRYPKDREVAEAVAGQWRDIGVNVSIEPLEWGAFVKEAQEKNWQMFLISQGPLSTHLLFSSCFCSRTKGLPWLHYENATVDDLIERSGMEMDPQRRTEMFHELSEVIHDDAPWIFLQQYPSIYAYRDRVQGWRPGNEIIMLLDTWLKS